MVGERGKLYVQLFEMPLEEDVELVHRNAINAWCAVIGSNTFPASVEGRKGAYGGVDVHVLRLEDEQCEPTIGEAEEYDHQHALVSSLRHMRFFA
jgi:hypothetical protein